MIIGFMRNFKNPPELAELTAKMSKYYGIEIVYLRPDDVNIKDHTAIGMLFIEEQWVEKEVELPKIIDISPYCFKRKNRKIIKYLRENCYLTDNHRNRISKEKLQEYLINDSELSYLVIPTKRYETVKDIVKGVKKHGTIVLKPIKGERGKGIYIISKKGRKYRVGYKSDEYIIPKRKLDKFFSSRITRKYIFQKYVNSRSLSGDPFDIRVHFEKNGKGKWSIAKIYVRIGIGQTVISNIYPGGTIVEPKGFLKQNFPDIWKEIYQKLLDLVEIFPYKYEALRKTDIMSLGIDIGVDREGNLYIFEANSAPVTEYLRAEVVNYRTQYYNYLVNNKI